MIFLGKGKIVDYGIKLRENTFSKKDFSKNCVNYPNDGHETYIDCDDDFLASAVPSGLVPIWVTNKTQTVTNSLHLQNFDEFYFGSLFVGEQLSPCPLPCTTLHVESRLLREADFNYPIISLAFSKTVVVTNTHFIEFNFLLFLSDIGGSMGLWLGLGLCQALEICIKFGCKRIQK